MLLLLDIYIILFITVKNIVLNIYLTVEYIDNILLLPYILYRICIIFNVGVAIIFTTRIVNWCLLIQLFTEKIID
jgi:hypothetical protein